jgi:hypothetical protein
VSAAVVRAIEVPNATKMPNAPEVPNVVKPGPASS